MSRKKILIISEYIAPVRAVASIRWSSFAKYLSLNHGYDVTVLTNQKCFDGKNLFIKPYYYDSSLEENMRFFATVVIPQTLPQAISSLLFNIGFRVLEGMRKSAVSNATSKGVDLHSNTQQILESSLPERVFEIVDGWCCRAFASAGLKTDLDFSSYDVVISTYGPSWPHLLAKSIKERNLGICWIADFRDPIVRSKRTSTSKYKAMAGSISRGSDCVITVSKGFVECLHLPDTYRTEVIDNGFDPLPSSDSAPKENAFDPLFRLVYTGTLYSDDTLRQDMSPLFQSLDHLIDSGRIDANDVSVEYAGRNSDLFIAMSSRFPKVRIVDHGLVTRQEAMRLQQSASALIVCAWNTEEQKGVLTGKIYEYMQQHAPVIGICCGEVPNSDLRRLIETSHIGICFEEADQHTATDLERYLYKLYRDWKSTGRTSRDERAIAGVAQYSYTKLTDKLVTLIMDLSNDR